MSKKGRPKDENARNRRYSIRLTDDEYNKLRSNAKLYGQNMANFVRKRCIEE